MPDPVIWDKVMGAKKKKKKKKKKIKVPVPILVLFLFTVIDFRTRGSLTLCVLSVVSFTASSWLSQTQQHLTQNSFSWFCTL